ncbi:MAG: DUF531 domain-containing protein [Euryarchaeota archaeon]|nr:DUF531 domain-containing protein [Euryarchaeota archaeon]
MRAERKLRREIGRLKRRHIPSYSRALKRVFRKYLGELESFDAVVEAALRIPDSYYSAEVLSYIAYRGAEAGHPECRRYFSLAVEKAREVPQEWRRAEVLEVVARRMGRAGDMPERVLPAAAGMEDERNFRRVLKPVLRACISRGRVGEVLRMLETLEEGRRRRALRLAAVIAAKLGKAEELPPSVMRVVSTGGHRAGRRAGKGSGSGGELPVSPGIPALGRFTLGLYNTYRGSLKTAHIRAVARAAPLCHAYGMGLALFGFPARSASEVVERVSTESRICGGGAYLRLLRREGRLHLLPAPEEDFLPEVGVLAATTSSPREGKRATLEELVEHPGRVCLVMGLGRRGLPRSFLEAAGVHIELTGYGIPLETCTAMGVICERLRGLVVKK